MTNITMSFWIFEQ